MPEKEVNLNQKVTQPTPPKPGAPAQPAKPGGPPAPAAKPAAPVLKTDASQAEVLDYILSKNESELLPWEEVALPSMGLYYEGRMPSGKVEVRPMGLATDKVLATARLAQTGQALDEVFRRCVRFPAQDFDPLDLLVGDRVYLLFVLRGITHGNIYEFSVKCTNEDCEASVGDSYDLNQLSATKRGPKHQKEPVRVPLPYLTQKIGRDVWVDVRFMRGHDMRTIEKKKRQLDRLMGQHARGKDQKKPNSELLDQSIEENLNLLIVSANGVTERFKIQDLVSKLHARDTAAIRQVIRDDAPGIDAEIEVTCPECGTNMKMELPITESFFRPQESGGVRK